MEIELTTVNLFEWHFDILTPYVYISLTSKNVMVIYIGELSRNEKNFRRYLKQYHPDKYYELIRKENFID